MHLKNKRERAVDDFSNGLNAMEFPGPDPTREDPKNNYDSTRKRTCRCKQQ